MTLFNVIIVQDSLSLLCDVYCILSCMNNVLRNLYILYQSWIKSVLTPKQLVTLLTFCHPNLLQMQIFRGIFLRFSLSMCIICSRHPLLLLFSIFGLKWTVGRDVRWVENGLKQSILANYRTASLLFKILKRHHHAKSIKPVLASKKQLNWICGLKWQNTANDGLHTFNSIDFAASPELRARSYRLQATNYKAKRYEI
jgi:hypothetical protein